jgi:hypothetical protein
MNAYTATKKPRKMIGAFPRDRQLLRDVIAAGRTINPAVNGLTHVTATQAVLQAPGDPVYYLVDLDPAQARALGWMEV